MTTPSEAASGATTPSGALGSITRWLTASDHKIIGRSYLAAGLLGLVATAVVNVVLAIERVDGDNIALDADAFSQLFDAQRIGLVFAVVVPLALGASVVAVPLQLGARSLAFPRLAMFGFWMWLGGIVLTVVALANDGGTLGGNSDMVDLFLAGLAVMALGMTATAGSVATSVLTTRAPGMTMRRVPFFAWSALVTSIGIVLVMPVFFGTLIYLFLDHRNGRTAFGGNSGTATWVGWMFTQPASYLFAIPAVGLLAETLPIAFKKRTPARGVMFAGLSLIAVAAFAAITQQQIQNLPWPGSDLNIDDIGDKVNDLVPYTFFNLVPVLGMTLVLLMGLVLAKPQKGAGRPNITAAFVFAFFGYAMVMVGMLGTLLYSIDDLGLQGTVFEEATLVYVVYGAVLGTMGAVAHWAPKLWGQTIATARLVPLALLGVGATVLASFPHYIAGFLDQPTGVAYDEGDLAVWNILVTIGHALMALTAVAFIGLVVSSMRRDGAASGDRNDDRDGQAVGDDPWHGHTIEWSTTSPAPADNFVDVPMIHSAEPMLDLLAGSTTDGKNS